MSAPRDEKYFIDEGGGGRNAFEKLQQKNPAQENREKNTLGKQASEIVTWIETFCTN